MVAAGTDTTGACTASADDGLFATMAAGAATSAVDPGMAAGWLTEAPMLGTLL